MGKGFLQFIHCHLCNLVAHIDHGKSTLADRFLERTGVLSDEAKNCQVLDKLEVERSRGITVKAQVGWIDELGSGAFSHLILYR